MTEPIDLTERPIMNAITQLPIEQTLEFPCQEDGREYVFMAIEGQSPARQTKLIFEARACGLLNDQDIPIFLDACGLKQGEVT